VADGEGERAMTMLVLKNSRRLTEKKHEEKILHFCLPGGEIGCGLLHGSFLGSISKERNDGAAIFNPHQTTRRKCQWSLEQ
jgi:hypothetical protein